MAVQNIRLFQEKMESVKETLSSTQKVTTCMKQEIETLKAVNSKLQNDIGKIQQESLIIKRETNKTKEDTEDLAEHLKNFKEKSNFIIAFDARLSNDTTVGKGVTDIVLSNVKCNVGEAYNEEAGIFTAPVTGIYFFMARTVKVETTDLSLDIFVDGDLVAESLCSSGAVKASGSGLVHLVQKLTKGQEVSLSTYTSWLQATLRYGETSFCGILVRPELDIV